MAYCTVANVKRLLTKLTTSDVSDTDTGVELERGDSVIDAILGTKFTVPFVQVNSEYPPIIIAIAEELGVYRTGRIIYTKHQSKKNEWIDGFKEAAMEKMDMLLSGTMALIDDDGTLITTTTNAFKVSPSDVDSSRIFGLDEYYDGMSKRYKDFKSYDNDNLET